MAELKDLELQIAQLSKKIDEQMRIARNVQVLCTTLIVGIIFFIFTQTIEHMPSMIVLHFMSNLDSIVKEWRQAEQALPQKPADPRNTR
jgi:hypothetical protein